MKIKSISFYYPPLNSSEGYATYKLYNKSKFDIYVISQKKFSDWTYSDDLINPKNTLYLDSKNISSWKEDVLKEDWSETQVLITRSMPNSSHIMGLKIKKQNPDIKWIAFFSDPFSNSPIALFEFKKSLIKSIKKFNLLKMCKLLFHFFADLVVLGIYEKLIYKKCDVIIFNNEYQERFMAKNKHKDKVEIIPHSWSSDLIKNSNETRINEKITFSFAGSISDARNLDNFLKAFNKIKNDDKYRDIIQLFIVSKDITNILNCIEDKNVNIISNLSYLDCTNFIDQADWLINSDACISKRKNDNYIYLPCKLIDYLAMNRNIINISNYTNSPTVELVEKCKGYNLPDNEIEIFNFIKKIADEKIYKREPNSYIKMYEDVEIAKKFDSIVEKLLDT